MEHKRKVESVEDRESRLRGASQWHVRELMFGGEDRLTVLGRVRDKVPGFPAERYEKELDDAQLLVASNREHARDFRTKLIAAARQEDVLNAVFALHYFNRRYSGHYGQYCLGPINVQVTLGSQYDRAEIDAAMVRSNALIEDGWRCAYDPDAYDRQKRQLREDHPGFNERHLGEAMGWGFFYNR